VPQERETVALVAVALVEYVVQDLRVMPQPILVAAVEAAVQVHLETLVVTVVKV
jgi:hypothetical protein